MSLNSIFQYFIPKDKKFFPLFEKDSANLIKLGEKLVEAVNTEDLVKRKELFKDISDFNERHSFFNYLTLLALCEELRQYLLSQLLYLKNINEE